MNRSYQLSASIICSTFSDIQNDLKLLEKGKIDAIHFDVMDGAFVPRLGLFPEYLQMLKSCTNIPIHVHMMVSRPDSMIDRFIEAGADTISIHAEIPNALRSIQMIKMNGIKAGIALNPETDIDVLDFFLSEIDHIIVMAIHPGILGQKIIPYTYKKIETIKKRLASYPHIILEIDGGVTPQTAPLLIQAGADMLVCGTGTIFQPQSKLDRKIVELKKDINTFLSG